MDYNGKRTFSGSSVDSAYLNRYNYNNLPSFASSSKESKQSSNGFNDANNGFISSNTSLQHNMNNISSDETFIKHKLNEKAELPFVPSNHPINKTFFTESRLPPNVPKVSKPATNIPSYNEKFSENQFRFPSQSLFGSRVWSSGTDVSSRLFSNRSYLFNQNKINDIRKEKNNAFISNDIINGKTYPYSQFIHLMINLGYLIYMLLNKGFYWIIWLLNSTIAILVNKIRTIPNPEWKDNINRPLSTSTSLSNDIDMAHSTPMINKTKMIFQDSREANAKPKNPLFYEKLREINERENGKVVNEDNNGNNEELANSTEILMNERDIENRQKPQYQYGTRFFNNNKTNGNPVNLENYFLKAALNIDKRPKQDLYKKSNEVKKNLLMMQERQPIVEINRVNKPTFTRSTTRFQDLEWLKDDRDDYLKNLESTKLFKEYQNIIAERKKMQQLLHLSKLKEHGLGIRPLKEEQNREIELIWLDQPEGTLINKYRINITSRDLFTLSDRHWLNDNIIDFYLQLVKDYVMEKKINKVHVFSTYFYTTLKSKGYDGVKKWAKRAKVDVNEMDYIFVPVNLNQSHWTLAVIDNLNKNFTYVDSLFGDGTDILYLLKEYMENETKKNNGGELPINFDIYNINGNYECPTQQNGYDCGVFTCTAVDFIARNRELDYSQADMSLLRRRMAYEILHGELLNH